MPRLGCASLGVSYSQKDEGNTEAPRHRDHWWADVFGNLSPQDSPNHKSRVSGRQAFLSSSRCAARLRSCLYTSDSLRHPTSMFQV
ncbi:Zinc/cadmium resistance protein [Fusarium oxysporum f. sp. albedinis]|nr:Zinc/cadmium resistance protein [Fusarium oxysporum f. sp. albedinis]